MPYPKEYREMVLSRILAELRRHKSGIWLKELAELLKMSPQRLRYFVFSFQKNTNPRPANRGGYLMGEVQVSEKYNRRIFLKPKNGAK